jgi:pilus assembly protein FimV
MQAAVIVGVGVTMDNMLYIIAGLVIVLLIAVLIMRKNKAQKPSGQSGIQNGKTESLSTHASSKSTLAQTANNNEKKFDHIDIAQRFIDQQRYDKAIETLNRGLNEKPNDSQMSLKLLAVYATIDESDNFNKVYDAIKANNDEKSIAQANDLKALITEEHDQIAKQALPANNSQNAEFESLNFDLPTNKAAHNNPVVDTPTADFEYKNDVSEFTHEPIAASNNLNDSDLDSSNFEDIEQAFDLSLSDLEDTASEPADTTDVSNAPDLTDDNILTTATSETEIENSIDSNNIDADFDFDWSEQSSASKESPVDVAPTQDSVNDGSNELTLDDDFVLDLADLDVNADTNTASNNEAIENEAVIADSTAVNDDRLVLSLDSAKVSNEPPNQTDIQQPIAEDAFDDFIFEDISFENTHIEDISVEEAEIIKNESEASSVTSTTLMFDDNTLIDDDFDFDNLSEPATTSMPVASEHTSYVGAAINIAAETEIDSTKDFSARFAADFDFVKSLDSNQVTLDLAGQYVQLGEYDSAKRLLNEVIAQGDSEQQQQAQQLLERTA